MGIDIQNSTGFGVPYSPVIFPGQDYDDFFSPPSDNLRSPVQGFINNLAEFTKSVQPIDIDAIVQELVPRSGSTPSNE